MTTRTRLLLLALLSPAVAAAQVTVSPAAVEVTLAEGEATEVVLSVRDAGSDTTQAFALSLAPAEDTADGEPGDLLFASAPDALRSATADLTTTSDGRIFVAEAGVRNETSEFTPTLELVREFAHPTTSNRSSTLGIAFFGPEEGAEQDSAAWWIDVLADGGDTEQAFLLEGDLDGEPTGRSFALPFGQNAGCGFGNGRPASLVYEASPPPAPGDDPASRAPGEESGRESGRFYYLDIWDYTIWAVDTLGAVIDGYPVSMTDYAGRPTPESPEGCLALGSLDAHALAPRRGEPGEPVFEVLTGETFALPATGRPTKVVVTDRAGRNRGAETPLFDLPPPDGFERVLSLYGVVRSRLDPSILYLTGDTGGPGDARDWVYAVRAAPLPPVWLFGSPILFETEGAAETEITLRLDASGLEAGVYEAVVSVREGDGIGPVVAEVPVTLTVATVSAEGVPEGRGSLVLGTPYPNPAERSVTVPLALSRQTDVKVAVYNVLGREVAALHDGPLPAGEHALAFDATGLPSGVYVVQVEAGGRTFTERLTALR